MYIGWPVLSMSLTAVRSDCGQAAGGPSGDADQSCARIKAPISPPPSRKSSAPRVGATAESVDLMPSFPTPARRPCRKSCWESWSGILTGPQRRRVRVLPAAVLISHRVVDAVSFVACPGPGLGGAARAPGLDGPRAVAQPARRGAAFVRKRHAQAG